MSRTGEVMSGGKYVYDYPRPALTVDIAVFALVESELRVLVIRRGSDPFAGKWALPGGFVNEGESFEVAALRELKEETGLALKARPIFLGNYGKKGRDPRGWTVSIAHIFATRLPRKAVAGSDDASDAAWLAPDSLKGMLAFDHDVILKDALELLRREIDRGVLGAELLPKSFSRPEAAGMLKAVGASVSVATWTARGLKAGRIERSPGDPKLFRRV